LFGLNDSRCARQDGRAMPPAGAMPAAPGSKTIHRRRLRPKIQRINCLLRVRRLSIIWLHIRSAGRLDPPGRGGVIEVQNLRKSFGRQIVLDGISFSVPRGSTAVVIGGSGTGKSVLLRHINGLLKPEAGQVIVDGVDITQLYEPQLNAFRLRVGMVFQGSALFDSLTVAENVAFALREHTKYSDGKIRTIIREKLHLMGLSDIDDKMPAELSGGMKKRVAIARAIALEPEVMLYDEPTAGLDPRTADSINNLIIKLQETMHATAVAVTHDMASAFKIADRIYMLKDGNFIAEGTADDIRGNGDPDVRKFIGGQAPAEAAVPA